MTVLSTAGDGDDNHWSPMSPMYSLLLVWTCCWISGQVIFNAMTLMWSYLDEEYDVRWKLIFRLVSDICVSELGQHWFSQWLVACLAPSHYLNQYRLIVNWTLRGTQFNEIWLKKLVIHENAFENVVCKMAGILSRARWVNAIEKQSVCCAIGYHDTRMFSGIGDIDKSHHMPINALRPVQNCRHFTDDILKCIFLSENVWILLQFVNKVRKDQHWSR